MRVPRLLDTLICQAGFTSLADWARAANVAEGTLYAYRQKGLRPGPSVMRRLLAAAQAPIDPEAFADALLVARKAS